METSTDRLIDEPEAVSKKRSQRWRWWLVGMLALIVIVFVSIVGYRYQRQMSLIRRIESAGGSLDTEPWGPEWLRELVGEDRMRGFEDYRYVDLAPLGRAEALRELSGSQFQSFTFLGGEVTAEEAKLFRQLRTTSAVSFEECSSINDEMYLSLADTPPNGLFFYESRVEVSDFARLKQMTQLQGIWLDGSLIVADAVLPERMFPGLTYVSFRDSSLTDEDLSVFRNLNHLKELDLSGTKVTDSGLKYIRGFKRLEDLSLVDTGISDSGLIQLQFLSQITVLDLRNTNVTGRGLEKLTCLPRLESLALNDSAIDDDAMRVLSSAVSLRELYLSGTAVGDEGIKHIKSLSNLEILYLGGTKITDAGLKHLAGLSNIQDLNLLGTKVTEAGVKKLKNTLPPCRIFSDFID